MNDAAQHWTIHVDAERIAWLELNRAGKTTNTLSNEVMRELEIGLTNVLLQDPVGLIFVSGKASGFIAGADISEFEHLVSAEQGAQLAMQGQALLARIEKLPIPTVAAINGLALGGGLELALATNYRVAAESSDRCLGLPEVQLGIHPGFGGTVRTVQLLGAPAALDLMLKGKPVTPAAALEIGLVDRVVPASELRAAAVRMIRERPAKRAARWYLRLLSRRPVRAWLGRQLESKLRRRVPRQHYPAPYAIVDLWRRFGAAGENAYRAEAESIGTLLMTPTCRNLVRVFFLRERLRSLAPKQGATSTIHVIGAGLMGSDIAAWCAKRGLRVSIQDRGQDILDKSMTRIREQLSRSSAGAAEVDVLAQRVSSDLDGSAIPQADIVLEAIIEKLEAKQELFRGIESKLAPDAVLATNTSSIVLEEIAKSLMRPERFVGLHFFNPVARLPLVEVIKSSSTDQDTMQRAIAFVTQIGKLPLPCRSAPGFLVNRILTPYMLEALRAHQDGYALETIDAAAQQFGMPMGPIELADRVGLDVAAHVIGILSSDITHDVPDVLQAMVASGRVGLKSGAGFYRYESGRPVKAKGFAAPDAELTDRLILPLLNESVACLSERIVEDEDLLDAGVIFGTGFAPFRGGPLCYARQQGVSDIVGRLQVLAQLHGTRFTPHPGWMALTGPAAVKPSAPS